LYNEAQQNQYEDKAKKQHNTIENNKRTQFYQCVEIANKLRSFKLN
jgi:hypothetical protein